MFGKRSLPDKEVKAMSPQMLAHLGDAVFHLFERERQILASATASQMHQRSTKRASAIGQADLLDLISARLTDTEADLVRRARNLKTHQRRPDQAAYRLATAFEALLGYLYLTNPTRLEEVLNWTLEERPEPAADDDLPNV
jgi:ribonuclease III family protein